MKMWSLPGPRAYLEEIGDKLHDCHVLLLERLGHRNDIGHAIVANLKERELRATHHLDVRNLSNDSTPAEIIARRTLPPDAQPLVSSPAAIASAPMLEGDIIWIEGVDYASWPSWDIFLRAFSRELGKSRLNPPPSLGFGVEPGLASAANGRTLLTYSGSMNRLDTNIWVAERFNPQGLSALEASLLATTIVELCGWNLEAAGALIDTGRELLLDPQSYLNDLVVDLPSSDDHQSEMWDGHPFQCVFSIVRNGDNSVIARRLWRAQLSVLFPWLEEIRLAIIDKHRSYLTDRLERIVSSLDRRNQINSVDDLEFSEIRPSIQAGSNANMTELVEICRRIRNQLAHRSPAGYSEIRRALSTANRVGL